MTGRRWGRNPGLFVVGGQVPAPEDLRPEAVPAPLETGNSSAVTIEGVTGQYQEDGEGHRWFTTDERLTAEQVDSIAAAIHWDQSTAAEPYQRDVTRTMDDTTRMGNSLSAAVRLELLSDDMRAAARAAHDERSAAEYTADQLAAADDECGEHVPMLDGRCALCGVRIDPVSGAELDPVDGLPIDQDDEDAPNPELPGYGVPVPAPHNAAPFDHLAAHDAWDSTAELPVVPLTVADLQAELAPRTYAAPRPVPPAEDPAVPMSPERSRSTGGAAARILNWTSRHDERSLAYGIRAQLTGPAPLVDKTWAHGPILDQGTAPPLSLHDASGCTGHAGVNAANVLGLAHGPDADLYGHEDAMRLYDRAQELDDVPGEDYPGTSVLALMRAGQEFGLWASYSWAFGTRDVAQAILQAGPVVIGIPWLSGMSDPGTDGVVTVAGDDLGGHCLCLFALRMAIGGKAGPWFGALQTWGESVGDHGVIWLHHRDLAGLLHSVGEAAVPHMP